MSVSTHAGDLLLEYTKLEFLLLGDLRSALEERDRERDNRWLLTILDRLVETVPREFELREEGGYLREVLDVRPTLSPEVEMLQAEHSRIFLMLRRLRDSVARKATFTFLADQLQSELRDWMALLVDHNRRERALFQTTFNHDVGCAD